MICIAGNIGVGKTSLTQIIGQTFNITTVFEPVGENPYLESFYSDMSRWALHSQLFFLKERISQVNLIRQTPRCLIDRSLFEDAEVFARNLADQEILTPQDWELYQGFYQFLRKHTPAPKLMVFLSASIPTLQHRIKLRSRIFEKSMSNSYLSQLNICYERWFDSYDLSPKLRIETDGLDFVESSPDRELILAKIKAAGIEI